MTEIKLNATRYFIPTSITAAALCIVTATDQESMPFLVEIDGSPSLDQAAIMF